MELALLTVICAVVGGGVAGALVVTWSLHLRTYSLEKQVLQQRNHRAAEKRWSGDQTEGELSRWLADQKKGGVSFDNEFPG